MLAEAAQQAAQKESAITVRITLGDETGGFLEWSTAWGTGTTRLVWNPTEFPAAWPDW